MCSIRKEVEISLQVFYLIFKDQLGGITYLIPYSIDRVLKLNILRLLQAEKWKLIEITSDNKLLD